MAKKKEVKKNLKIKNIIIGQKQKPKVITVKELDSSLMVQNQRKFFLMEILKRKIMDQNILGLVP